MLASRTRVFTVLSTLLMAAGTLVAQSSSLGVRTGVPVKTSVLTSQIPAIVTNGTARRVAEKSTTDHMQLVLNLPLRNEAELDQLLSDLYNPASPLYHHYLTPQEFDYRFGPTQADYTTLINWAKSNGLNVNMTMTNRRLIQVDAPVDVINSVFHVKVTNYHDMYLNRDFFAPDVEPTTDLSLPLLEINGLDNAAPKKSHYHRAPTTAPLPTYISASGVTSQATGSQPVHHAGSGPAGYYLPSDMRAAYYGGTDLNGAGQTLAVFSYDGYNTSDLTGFYTSTGTTQTVPVTNVLVGGFSGACQLDNPCDDGEQTLDIVNAAGMAPGLTKILFYESSSSSTELAMMASDNTAKVITSSWGGGDFGTASDTYFKQFGTQGQTYLNATGDSGGFNSSTYDPPSLDANIIQVGGTTLTTNGAGGGYVTEVGWSDSGGGYWVSGIATASKILIPTWQSQTGVVTTTNKASATYRNSPDIGAEGDYDNIVYDNGALLGGYGGTSFATPRYAGYFAMANQQSIIDGGSTIGFIDPTLYTLGLGAAKATTFNDVTSGSNPSTAGTVKTYYAVAGYDLVTGWGSPNYAGLINQIAGAGFSVAPASASVNVTRGTMSTNSIAVTGYGGFNQSVTFTASGLPTGVTASFTTGTTTTPATMTITSGATTGKPGTYTVSVTGTYGSISHTKTFVLNSLKRTGGDFTLSADNPTIVATQGGSNTITVVPGSGLAGPISLVVTGFPAGVTAVMASPSSYSTDVITYTSTLAATAGTYPILMTGTSADGLVHTASFTLTITSPPSLIVNGGFETGVATPWTLTSGVLCTAASCGGSPHSGTWFAFLNGYGTTHTDSATQSVTITAGSTKATLGVWFLIATAETTTTAKNDTFTITLTNSSGTVLTTLGSYSNLDATGVYGFHTYDVSAYIGQTVTVSFVGVENASLATSFFVDDVELVVQ